MASVLTLLMRVRDKRTPAPGEWIPWTPHRYWRDGQPYSRQDLRFDIPVIGLDTLKTFARADAKALALEAGSTLVFDLKDFLREADRLKLAVCAFTKDGPQ